MESSLQWVEVAKTCVRCTKKVSGTKRTGAHGLPKEAVVTSSRSRFSSTSNVMGNKFNAVDVIGVGKKGR